MKVSNMQSNAGNDVANQFIIVDGSTEVFQSYDSIIAKRSPKLITKSILDDNGKCVDTYIDTELKIVLDERYWDYSATTGKYRNQFLNEGIAETRKKIESGEYVLADLN